MPTTHDDAPEPPARGGRRPLGRGPGTHAAAPRAATPRPQPTPTPPAGPEDPAGGDPVARGNAVAAHGPGLAELPPQPVAPPGPPEPAPQGPPDAPAPDAPLAPPRARVPRADAPEASAPRNAAEPEAEGPDAAEPGAAEPSAAGQAAPAADGAAEDTAEGAADGRFTVRLANFEGPFDLLLQLISRHKLDVTEVALSKVTDEFMAHIRAMGTDWDLDQTTEFLVVAATLLDLKAARLLPAAEVEDEADLALLEARDLLFARLLQYRAYKTIADVFAERLADEARRHPRTVGLEPHHAELLPEVVISIGPEGFARLAVKAMQPRPRPQVYVDHIHAPLVSVREQAEVVVARLRECGEAAFADLVADTDDTLTVVARFLALLELYRERVVALEQPEALGALTVRWTGEDGATVRVTDEFDQESRAGGRPGDETRNEEGT
ncbi:segregation and condensation protein A [Streptomyces sp. NPDC059740]|uniref:segregation and condensation protein A n=1 Tax=Streptomyces sp. NPDC059740 TaxID=3346926 RepID=UPI00365A72BC